MIWRRMHGGGQESPEKTVVPVVSTSAYVVPPFPPAAVIASGITLADYTRVVADLEGLRMAAEGIRNAPHGYWTPELAEAVTFLCDVLAHIDRKAVAA